jgi:hypothetical protein
MVSGAGKKAVGAGVVLGGIEAGYRIFPETLTLEPSVNAVFFAENGAGWFDLTLHLQGKCSSAKAALRPSLAYTFIS